jgi:hypothetical protein
MDKYGVRVCKSPPSACPFDGLARMPSLNSHTPSTNPAASQPNQPPNSPPSPNTLKPTLPVVYSVITLDKKWKNARGRGWSSSMKRVGGWRWYRFGRRGRLRLWVSFRGGSRGGRGVCPLVGRPVLTRARSSWGMMMDHDGLTTRVCRLSPPQSSLINDTFPT